MKKLNNWEFDGIDYYEKHKKKLKNYYYK